MMVRRIFTLLGLAFCFLGLAAPAHAQDARPPANPNDPGAPATPKKDLCAVSGTVVALAGGEPFRKVRVRLENSDDRTKATAVVTNVDGHFEFKSVDPGHYRLSVSRVGYVTQNYGQRKPQDPGAILTLRPAQEMKDLVFRMISAAVVAGRIVDEDGEPLPGVSVSAMKETYDRGKRTLLPNFAAGSAAESNDLGEYRLYGLSPGRYFISAVYNLYARVGGDNPSDTQQASPQGYARMFYPGTADRAKATSIAVKAGEEVSSVEIVMRQVVVYHLRGRVYNQITHRPGKDCYVFLMTKGGSYFSGETYAQVEKPAGSFDVPEVLPGSYALVAMWFDQGKNYVSRVSVDVGNADVEGVGITLGQGVAVSGRVVWDGKPSLEADDLTIGLAATDHSPAMENPARVNPDGSFTLEQVSDGSYDVSPNGQSKDCYLKNVEYAGSGALDDGFTPARGSAATLEVTLSSRGARVQGAATDEDSLPAAGVWVALVPDSEARRAKHRLYKSQTTDQYGHFDLRGIAPGDYRLFSWSQVDEGAWEDPDFIKPLLDKNRGEKISVQEGDTKTVNVVAIPSEKTEQGKE